MDMLTDRHNDNGGGYAAAAPLRAAQVTGPPLQPQGSLTRSLPRRPTAALDPGDLYGPWQTHTAGRPKACPTGARRGTPTELQDHHNRVSTVSGDCRGIAGGSQVKRCRTPHLKPLSIQ